jgi:crotonobetainyl-CoA:carnitine CoA-transferase CaiB-like acyl-CoA transferase
MNIHTGQHVPLPQGELAGLVAPDCHGQNFFEIDRSLQDLLTLSDPQLDHRGLLVEAGKLHCTSDPVTLLGAPFVANEDGPHQKAEPPFQVGQHSREVLEELGFSASEITKCLETTP